MMLKVAIADGIKDYSLCVFLEMFQLPAAEENDAMKAVSINQNGKVVVWTLKFS